MREILQGDSTPVLIASLLTALRMKGETVAEVTGFARAMRAASALVRPASTPSSALVDTCGTGGDGGGTFNVSTAAALVVAGADVSVAKHGNRSISSKCGSADVLEALGVRVDLNASKVADSIDQVGIGFLFAMNMHPAMRFAGPVRRDLGMRTVFNMLGPLTNPASAGIQVMGVFERGLVSLAAEALAGLGTQRALVVHGSDGLDEITLTGPTHVAEVCDGAVTLGTLKPADFGVAEASAAALAGADADTNAAIIRAILAGKQGPERDIVLVNAGAVLHVAGRAASWRDGADLAACAIDSGAAAAKLARLAEFTQAVGPEA